MEPLNLQSESTQTALAETAALQTWLRACGGQALLTGWPALHLALRGMLPQPPAIQEIAVPLPTALTTWTVLVNAAHPLPSCPATLPVALQPLAAGEAWGDAVDNWLRGQQIRAFAIAVDAQGEVRDPLGVLTEAREGKLRLQGDPRAVLHGNYAQVFNLATVSAWTGLRPSAEIARQVRRDHTLLLTLDRQVWRDGLNATLVAPHAATGLRFLLDAGVMQLLVPEATAMVDFHKSSPAHHKDIWDHTLQVIEKCPPHLVVRWSALMHDTGKVLTRSFSKGKVHFFGHEQVGALLMEGVAARLGLEPQVRDRVVYVIGHHARANAYLGNWTDSAVRRLVKDMGEHLPDVLAFSRSDWTTKRAGRIAEVQSLTAELAERIPVIVAEAQRVPPLPKGLGTYVLAQTGLQAGPWLGRIQEWLEKACDEGQLEALQEPAYYLTAVRDRAPELLAIAPGTERQKR